ncbi:MAG: hypothetical protein DYH12_00790 [Sorangiineae bacterium PRO1]|nr:hypothetical protein [Sorangiineae bacterium PRO1]
MRTAGSHAALDISHRVNTRADRAVAELLGWPLWLELDGRCVGLRTGALIARRRGSTVVAR